jgi:hypothetical protein
MPDRRSFDSTLWLRALLTLLAIVASVQVAPTQTWGGAAVSSLHDCLQGNFAQRSVEPTILRSVSPAPDDVLQVKALAPEDEKQSWGFAPGESRVSFLMPWCFRTVPDRQLIASPSVLSLYHLRC